MLQASSLESAVVQHNNGKNGVADPLAPKQLTFEERMQERERSQSPGSPRRKPKELSRREKKRLYRLNTAAQESVSETVKELRDSVEELVGHEADWRRQKEEMKKYGKCSVFATTEDRERYLSNIRKEVSNTPIPDKKQLRLEAEEDAALTAPPKKKKSPRRRQRPHSPGVKNNTFRRSRTLDTKLPKISEQLPVVSHAEDTSTALATTTTSKEKSTSKSTTTSRRVSLPPIPVKNKRVSDPKDEPHRVISLKELKTPHICNTKLLRKQLEREERQEAARLAEWHAQLNKYEDPEKMTSSQGAIVPAEPIPDWLSTKSLAKRRYLPASTGNLHGLQAGEFHNTKWPLPKMFGQEKYAFSLIDIEDPRYVDECASMSKQLIHYFYDQQIFDLKWRETYKQLIRAEKRRANLPALASNKAKDELDGNVKKFKKYLLELQEQRDLYQTKIDGIFERCAQIKRGIKKENDLEELRMEMTGRVKAKFAQEDGFWSTQFNCTRPDDARGMFVLLDENILLCVQELVALR
ncbi:unnamed protein product [Amoebophrya sp. A120]|nr:unnamed protein product [Amoebophrya sp. A120]|eukprot:GSA120T00023987001.1